MGKIQYYCLKLEEWGGGKVKELHEKIKKYKIELQKCRSRRNCYGAKKYVEITFLKILEQQEVY